ncbi:GNAT family N-acetyltransferase [bacterium]|nr:GNAT family N-acetyltransferase [bacterium]
MDKKSELQSVFLNGKRVCLRPLHPDEDLTDYLSWMNYQEITRYLETGKSVTTIKSLRDYIIQNNSSNSILLGIFIKETGKHIGNIKLHLIDYQNRSAEIGIIIGDKTSQGQGYACESIRLLLDHAFLRLNLHRVSAGMVVNNIASKRVFEKSGFVLEGTLRESFLLDGTYHDCYRLGILESEYMSIPDKEA